MRPGQLLAQLDSQNEATALQSSRAQLTAAQAQLGEARTNFVRMRDLVAERAVSRAMFDNAETMQKTAESQVLSVQSAVTLAENRLSYTRLMSDVQGVVTAVGAEPGEVVGAGRMVVQVAREGMRDAVLRPSGAGEGQHFTERGNHGRADRRSENHHDRHDTGSVSTRGPGHRHVPRQDQAQQSARLHAAGHHCDRARTPECQRVDH